MSQADHRVPTAADVERWGKRWWRSMPKGEPIQMALAVVELGRVEAKRLGFGWPWHPIEELPGTWLGPVNPEPLPWPK